MSAITGVKGSDCYSSTNSTLNDLWIQLNRGLKAETITAAVHSIMTNGSTQDKIDLFVLAFQTRDIRGGKGERNLFYTLWSLLATKEPNAAMATIKHIPTYGYWEDLNVLAHKTAPQHLVNSAILYTIAKQISSDYASLSIPDYKLSLVGRHAPREHNHKPEDKALAKTLARLMFPGDKAANKKYRMQVVALSKALKVPEIAMSAKNWSSLDPTSMPGRCLKTKLKGLLNQPVYSKYGRRTVLSDNDRVTCAATFASHLSKAKNGEAKVKGADVVYPYELVAKVLKHLNSPETVSRHDDTMACSDDEDYNTYPQVPNPARLSPEELDAIEAQWRSIVDPIKALGTLGSWLPMCDFSGSMEGNPMNNAMALGLIIAECNTGVFKDTILTFDSVPTLYKFTTTGLVNRVHEIRHLAQGLSTDFQAAYNLILTTLIDNAVPASMWPKYLLCLTDMNFDSAAGFGQYSSHTNTRHSKAVKTGDHETHMMIIRRSFSLQAQNLFGSNAPAPPICVCWNLTGGATDFQAQNTDYGVIQVSGWSPSLIKHLATRGIDAFNSEQILRSILDDPRYDPVRVAVSSFLTPPQPLLPPSPPSELEFDRALCN